MNADDRTGLLLRERLASRTDALVARPDTAQRAAQGGQHRLRVRRNAFVGMAAVLLLAVVFPFTPAGSLLRQDATPAGQSGTDRYAKLLGKRTSGDLAGDESYRQAVLALWRDRTQGLSRGVGQDLRGDPVLVWAGRTKAGPAGLVAQRAYLPENRGLDPADAGRISTLIGFIGVNSIDQPTLVGYDYWRRGTAGDGIVGWFVDPGRNTLVIRDIGRKLGWNLADPARGLQPLAFHDGAAVAGVPEGMDPAEVRVRRFPEAATGSTDVQIAPPLLNPPLGERLESVVPLHGSAPSRVAQPLAEFNRALLDRGIATDPDVKQLFATGRVRGDEVLIGGGTNSHVYTVVLRSGATAAVIDSGALKFGQRRPVMMRLPVPDGWAVFAYAATLRWRSETGRWSDVGNPGIVPEAATDIETTAKNGRRTVTPLP